MIKTRGKDNLLWTDDKVKLLLVSARDFQAEKQHEAIDWESIKDKYALIKERLIRNFPDGKKERNNHIALHENVFPPK